MTPHRDHPASGYRDLMVDGAQLIDVREPDEVAGGALWGAVNIPLGDLTARAGELDPARRVVIVCRSGGRSTAAARMLTAAGFGDVVNLSGGMLAVAGDQG